MCKTVLHKQPIPYHAKCSKFHPNDERAVIVWEPPYEVRSHNPLVLPYIMPERVLLCVYQKGVWWQKNLWDFSLSPVRLSENAVWLESPI